MSVDIKSQILGFKSNLNKILVVVIIVIVVLLVCVGLIAWKKATEEVAPQEIIPEAMRVGTVGEIEKGKTLAEVNPEAIENPVRPPDTPMPYTIFNTSGT